MAIFLTYSISQIGMDEHLFINQSAYYLPQYRQVLKAGGNAVLVHVKVCIVKYKVAERLDPGGSDWADPAVRPRGLPLTLRLIHQLPLHPLPGCRQPTPLPSQGRQSAI
jgi:hypothetical protein